MLGFNIDVLCVFACMCLILFILFHLTFFFLKTPPWNLLKTIKVKKNVKTHLST